MLSLQRQILRGTPVSEQGIASVNRARGSGRRRGGEETAKATREAITDEVVELSLNFVLGLTYPKSMKLRGRIGE